MNIGKQIRRSRLRANMTQEKLAEHLGVTSQAVSKWETAAGCPDISLLPELSACLGITLDELFDSRADTRLRRLENMIENETRLSDEDFHYAEGGLKELARDEEMRPRAVSLLAELYLHQAEAYKAEAKEMALQALSLEQTRANHASLSKAAGGCLDDWIAVQHAELIDFYKQHVERFPADYTAYLLLIDNLLADGRLAEAEQFLEKMHKLKESFHDYVYRARLAAIRYGRGAEQEILEEMLTEYGDNCHAWFSRGNIRAKQGQYREALADFRKAAELEPRPRFIDSYESIARLCTLLNDKAGAVDAYQRIIEILQNDWQFPEGQMIQSYRKKIKRLEIEAG